MVNPVAGSGPSKVDTQRVMSLPPVPVEGKRDPKIDVTSTPSARIAKLGPPIDLNHVRDIRAAIAGGQYTVDADRLASAMLAHDLPVRGA